MGGVKPRKERSARALASSQQWQASVLSCLPVSIEVGDAYTHSLSDFERV